MIPPTFQLRLASWPYLFDITWAISGSSMIWAWAWQSSASTCLFILFLEFCTWVLSVTYPQTLEPNVGGWVNPSWIILLIFFLHLPQAKQMKLFPPQPHWSKWECWLNARRNLMRNIMFDIIFWGDKQPLSSKNFKYKSEKVLIYQSPMCTKVNKIKNYHTSP